MDGRVVGYAVDHVAVLLCGELGGFQIVVFFVHGDPPLSFLMVFMVSLLAGFLRGFLPSGFIFEPGSNGWAHPVRIARCWFQLIILHLLFGQRLCVGQFAPCHQPAVCHRTPLVVIVVDDGKRLVIRRLRVSSYVHGPLGGIIAVNALRSQLGMLDRRMV